MSFDPLKLATPIIKRVDYNFKSRTRAHVRLPIIMNGAGPAGLILAIGLQNANIPFEICETQRHDLPSKRRSNQVSLLERTTLAPLKKFLKDLSYESILDNVRVNTFPTRLEARGDAVHIKTEALLAMLRRYVSVNYGFHLENQGISCLESVISSQYAVGQNLKTFEGSLLVGADGTHSAGIAVISSFVAYCLLCTLQSEGQVTFGHGLQSHTDRL